MRYGVATRALRLLLICFLLICSSLITACAEQNNVVLPVLEDYLIETPQEERLQLKLGVVEGPYGDMFREIIAPLLAQKGYELEIIPYKNYNDPNLALANGDIDLNVFQHNKYLNNFKFERDLGLSAIAEVPTAVMGIYSTKYESLDEIEQGAVVAIPRDNTNLSRALVVLSTAGIIAVDPAVDSTKLTLKHVTQNYKNIKFATTETHYLTNALIHHEMAVINGNFAISGGLSLSDALFSETVTSHEYINVVAVRTDDLSRQFVMDFIDVLRSGKYKNAITKRGGKYSLFQYPCNFDTIE